MEKYENDPSFRYVDKYAKKSGFNPCEREGEI